MKTPKWQTRIGELVRETYKQQGYGDILIMIGATKGEDIHTQIWYPKDTATDFDIRFMVFTLNSHLFSEYNAFRDKYNDYSKL